MPVEFREKWDGPHWRWWSLLAGVALLLVTIAIGALLALVLGQDIIAFILLLLIAEVLGISAVGSGLLDSATRTMNRGGMAREGADVRSRRPRTAREAWTGDPEDIIRSRTGRRRMRDDEDDEDENGEDRVRTREQEEEDRRTIRSALVVLPVFVAFIVLLFQL